MRLFLQSHVMEAGHPSACAILLADRFGSGKCIASLERAGESRTATCKGIALPGVIGHDGLARSRSTGIPSRLPRRKPPVRSVRVKRPSWSRGPGVCLHSLSAMALASQGLCDFPALFPNRARHSAKLEKRPATTGSGGKLPLAEADCAASRRQAPTIAAHRGAGAE